MTNENIIGTNIRTFREQMGLTQDSLATYLGVKREVISFYETGSREPQVENLLKLADLFGCDLENLITDNAQDLDACLAFAFRADQLEEQDLESIAEFKKVVKNYLTLMHLKFADQ